MALLKKLVSSAVSQSGNISNEALLWPNVENFCCHREDEVFLHGGITGDPVPPFACQFSPGKFLIVIFWQWQMKRGSLRLLNTRKYAAQSLVKELATHSNAIFDITWKPGGEQIVSYSIDITVCKCVSYCL
ncbi:Denticleless protein homolog [Geodia barretti]|uniref:Denticleless protein homolog n=1 Tax=Geodia barretti TaxID=519541 RepID=A0AA35VZP3_GEOBA|nr:Denticleless protein homolog [Geodia barretti]